jgi:UDP-glucose 4-epimerase
MCTAEVAECCPVSMNGIVKLLNEKIIEEYCLAHDIKYEILRVFNLYGGRDQFSILYYIKKSLQSNQPFILNNNGIAQRDFIHVADVAGIILSILNNGMPYTHLNVGTGSATKISFLVDWVRHRFPHFQLCHRQLDELEYSRADVSRLSAFTKWEFLRIEDYLCNEFLLEKS